MSLGPGTLYGLGLGPGDPELITLKVARLLKTVDTVYAPVSEVSERSYSLELARPHLDPDRQHIVPLVFAMRSTPEVMARRWVEHAATIATGLRTGASAVFLTEGDPSFYSTFSHVATALRAIDPTLPVVTVPGVASPHAAAAAAGVPLADGDGTLAVLAATHRVDRIAAVLREFDTVVLMKVNSVLDRTLDAIAAAGRTGDALAVVRCGRPDETIHYDVAGLRGRRLDYFSLIIVRKPPCP